MSVAIHPCPKPPKRLPAERKRIKAQSKRERANAIRTADRLCSALVKTLARHVCEARWSGMPVHCFGPLDWAHGITRSVKATRWSHANTWAICRAHHRAFTASPGAWERFRIVSLGAGRCDALAEQSRGLRGVDVEAVVYALRHGVFIQGER